MSNIFSPVRCLRDYRLILCLCLCSLGITEQVFSTHIVGGSLSYNCLGNDMYEIVLTINRDCNLGADDAPFDDPASIGIFSVDGLPLISLGTNGQLLLDFQGDNNLQNTIQQICFSNTNNICVEQTIYKGVVELPRGARGYILAYQRCCRNSSLNNVVNPLETGLTLNIELTERALELCNSSPAFSEAPDIFICEGDVLEFDGSARDADGDELVYSLCTPFTGATIDDPRPQPPAGPPYLPIEWVQGFSANNPLGPTNAIFDSQTGMFTVTPESLGQFQVGMCVEEFRDGELLSRVTREFQYNVVRCSDQVVADFEVEQNGCSLNDVQFTNLTPGAEEFLWFFDYPSTDPAFMSTDPNPSFDYPVAGIYTIRLVANNGIGNCESIIDRHILISDGQSAQIQTSVIACPTSNFRFRVSDPIADRNQRQWLISVNGQQFTASSQFVDFDVEVGQFVDVELSTTSQTGCVESQTLRFNANTCDFIGQNPDNVFGSIDCDGDGVSNRDECLQGTDPDDGCDFPDGTTVDICAILAVTPDIALAHVDCDGDTFLNIDECNSGSDPSDGCSIPAGESIDICAILAADPDSPIGMFDCDNGGVDNSTECSNGTNPNDPGDDCQAALAGMVDICAIIAADPNSPLVNQDCDGDGFSNSQECQAGSNPSDGCDIPEGESIDICAILAANPNSPLGMFDCDNSGADNITECNNGTDPNDPNDDCQVLIDGMVDICALIAADPDSPLVNQDCDGDGFTNTEECQSGSDPSDGCDIPAGTSIDICAILAADPNSPLGMFDCDNGGADNSTECNNGTDPNNPDDDCQALIDGMVDICALIAADPNSPLVNLDCDGDGFTNAQECQSGSDPNDGCSIPAGENIDICAILAADPDSPLGMFDCDNGGADNSAECNSGTDPNNPNDDCQAIIDGGVDICTFLAENPDSGLAALDCDNDGVDNATECNVGTNPNEPTDACVAVIEAGLDICELLAANPDSELALFDCDGDGVDNITECNNGGDPANPNDPCTAAFNAGLDICALLAINPNSTLATLDCDGDGIDNRTECMNGTDPLNPAITCEEVASSGGDICSILSDSPDSPLGALDCDNDGIDNITECNNGTNPNDPTDACVAVQAAGLDICQLLTINPNSALALFDCDGDGVDNITECNNGGSPSNPDDPCTAAFNAGLDICALLAINPNSTLATLDCDGDGIDNQTECNNGTDPLNPEITCEEVISSGGDICTILSNNPDSPFGALDCDNDGVDNATECNNGTNPEDPLDVCVAVAAAGLDICELLAINPDSELAIFDCDGDGIDNATECNNGTDPSDPTDACTAVLNAGLDICAILAINPNAALAGLDCDGDGVDNITECNNGTDPNNPSFDCNSFLNSGQDICAFLIDNPSSELAGLDCDGDGFSNQDECNRGSDPADGCSIPAGESIDICAILANDPNSPLGMFDCDNGGVNNAAECLAGTNPNDPNDDCQAAVDQNVDICAIIAADPNSPLATLDCDGDTFSNLDECNRGSSPTDGCDIPAGESIDICAILANDPNSPLGMFDCDNGGIDNATECQNGTNPNDPNDDCQAAVNGNVDLCAILAADPNNPLATQDCDNGGIDNMTECNIGTNPLDPSDDCEAALTGNLDICALVAADPDGILAGLDCDGDTFTNGDECNRGSDPSDGCDIPDGESIDICAILAADPDSPLGMFDCDNGGIDNATECMNGTDPTDPSDDCEAAVNGNVDLCAILTADPNNPLATQDCDNGGIDNTTECNLGTDPLDPSDDCEAALEGMIDICALIAADPDSPLTSQDCDGDTFNNQDECDRGSNPSDGCDIPDGEMIDICAILAADPDSPLGMFDCDGGGINNGIECNNGGDPNDPSDECLSAFDDAVDICSILLENPNSPLADLDCDGDGFTNGDECNRGSDPADGCDIPDGETIDICAILAADPDNPLGMFDCDNGGVDNATECEMGTDPTDPTDECDAIGEGVDICELLAENPNSTLGALDCDGDGVDNATECENGTDPSDPNDNCPQGVSVDIGDGLGIPSVFCANIDTPIEVGITTTDDLIFEWAPADCIVSGGNTATPVINATSDKDLQLRVLNETLGCENTIIIPITVSDPSVSIIANPEEVIQGGDVELTAETVAQDPIFEWNTGESTETIDATLNADEDFSVTITDAFGCMATASTTVTVNDAECNSSGIFLPNAFTPNGDGVNDVLFVRSNAIQSIVFSVFDRWGREVFRSESIDDGWNGRWQNTGDELPPDAYGYWIEAVCLNGEEYQDQGNVSILR